MPHTVRLITLLVMCAPAMVAAQDPFATIVRPTEPLSPADQLAKFHVPGGFEVQLVAAEPELQKPMNIAFDARGRLWVSGSVEYPFAANEGEGHDSIRVLEDTDDDGRADKISTFVDGLNIPMGLYPYRNGVVAYSIPNIYFFDDTDGDGKCDRREVLYGPLGDPVDTHGMQNAFRRGFDGWLYICHGFRNESLIRGRDGSQIQLQSGNTYRVRLDGSRVEQFTWGQVNPFGQTFLPDGDLISADCHSLPLSLLLRGGYYTSFGKPHDGLGFVPPIMAHGHGSTAIAGAAYCDGDNFPIPYRGSLFVGNVMTCRVHRDSILRQGASLKAMEGPDFLTCDDPWFRPVDLQFGPDGALYIADFYNRIIGHYEVPLDHPQRDRQRGRIWRVVYKGDNTSTSKTSLAEASPRELVATLGSSSLTKRMLATDQLSDRYGDDATSELRIALAVSLPTAHVHALWALHRIDQLRSSDIAQAAGSEHVLVRMHAMRLLAEAASWTSSEASVAINGLSDASPLVRRPAADALAQHPQSKTIIPLLACLDEVAENDIHQRQAIMIALRNELRRDGGIAALSKLDLNRAHRLILSRVALAVPSPEAAAFLINCMRVGISQPDQVQPALKHAAANASGELLDELVALARKLAGDEVDLQVELLQLLQQQFLQRGLKQSTSILAWGTELAKQLLESIDDAKVLPRDFAKRQVAAANIARTLALSSFEATLAALASREDIDDQVRIASLETILALKPHPLGEALLLAIRDPAIDRAQQLQIGRTLIDRNLNLFEETLRRVMQTVPTRLQEQIAEQLATNRVGGELLLTLVAEGKASARLLQRVSIERSLNSISLDNASERILMLTKGLSPANEEITRTIQQQLVDFLLGNYSTERGSKLFEKHCSACHQVAGKGALVGPQLDGIGNRGLERVAEDMLDPSRNIDAAFHVSVIATSEGRVLTGLYRRTEGQAKIYAGKDGKEFSVLAGEIDEERKSRTSIMPDNLGAILSKAEVQDLLAYLFSLRARP